MDRHQFLPSHKPTKEEWPSQTARSASTVSEPRTGLRDVGFTETINFAEYDLNEEENDSLQQTDQSPASLPSGGGGGKSTFKLQKTAEHMAEQRAALAANHESPRHSQERPSSSSQLPSPWRVGGDTQSSRRQESPPWSRGGGGGGGENTIHFFNLYFSAPPSYR